METMRPTIDLVSASDIEKVLDLCSADPVGSVLAAHAIVGVRRWQRWPPGVEVWGAWANGALLSACFVGGNFIPIGGDADLMRMFAEMVSVRRPMCSSLLGPRHLVAPLWEAAGANWREPRAVRDRQLSMAITSPSPIEPDERVRVLRPDELDVLQPAAEAMFVEELGYSPLDVMTVGTYRNSLTVMLERGCAFGVVERVGDEDRLLFKAEIGATAQGVAQLQGVWVRPTARGRGLAAPAVAAVTRLVQERIAPTVSLYVNDFNAPAIAAYRRAGFRDVGEYMTVLF